jgi:hypothetical protein
VLQVYASFCDTVLNDAKLSEKLLGRIDNIQTDDFEREGRAQVLIVRTHSIVREHILCKHTC